MRDQRRPEGPLAEESAVTAVVAPHPSPQLPQVFWQYLPARNHLRHCITAELGDGSRQTVCEGLRKYQLAATTRYGGQKLRSSSSYSTTKGLHSGSGSAGPAHHWLHLPRVRCTHNPNQVGRQASPPYVYIQGSSSHLLQVYADANVLYSWNSCLQKYICIPH